jgi:hypothetical protein
MFRTARAAHSQANRERIQELIASDIDWQVFLAALERHHVAPLVYATLARVASERLPGKVIETLRVRTKITSWKNERFALELARLNEVFQARGRNVLNYKGAVAAVRFYGDVTKRTFNDLDFLVRREDLRPILALLELEGYRNTLQMNAEESAFYETEFKEYLYTSGDFQLEPHWSIAPRRYPFDLDYDGIWRRAQPLAFKDTQLLVMAAEDELHVLAMAGAKGWWKRFQMVTDIAHCIASNPTLDWQWLLAEARATGSERIVLLAAWLAAELQDVSIPVEVLARSRGARAVRRLGERIVDSFVGRPPVRRYLPDGPHIIRRDLLVMRERLGDRLRYLWRTATTPLLLHRRRLPLPKALHWLYAALVPAHDYVAYPARAVIRELVDGWRSAAVSLRRRGSS